MYLALITISLISLFVVDWKIALPILIIVFSLDRVMDGYRKELDEKKKNRK